MRDATRQLTVAEQVGIWTATVRPVRYLVQVLSMVPLIPLWTLFPHDGVEPWVVGPIVILAVGYFIDRRRRIDFTDDEERRLLTAQLTGWSTGDARLDGVVVYRSTEAMHQRHGRVHHDWLLVAMVAGVITASTVIDAVFVSPWWLLCVLSAPLYLALPVARAQSDPAGVVYLLGPTLPADHAT